MSSALLGLLVVGGLLLVVLVVTVVLVGRSLGQASRAVTALSERLAHAEAELAGLRSAVDDVAGEVVDVATTVRAQRDRVEAAPLTDDRDGRPARDEPVVTAEDGVGSHHG